MRKHAPSGCEFLFRNASNCFGVVGGDARPRLNCALRRLTARNSAQSLLTGKRSTTSLPLIIVLSLSLFTGAISVATDAGDNYCIPDRIDSVWVPDRARDRRRRRA